MRLGVWGRRSGLALTVFVLGVGTGSVPSEAEGDGTGCATLEDFYGETGKHFQAAFGLRTFQPTAGSGSAPNSYGVAVDDMVVSWKETRLDEDSHDCNGSGACAGIELSSTLSYDSNALVEITVTDTTPYDPAAPRNDCNGDGDFSDPGDDTDCNDDGIPDVTVKLTSDAELAGETAVLDRVAPGSAVYRTRFPYSTAYDSPGTLFLQVSGSSQAVVTARYVDRNDGTGVPCKNALDPSQRGILTTTTTVAVTAGRVDFGTYAIKLVGTAPLNGDNDGFADAQETVDMTITVVNKSGVDLDDLTAWLGTTDPKIECISRPSVTVPAVPGPVLNNATATSAPFRFKVANVNRTSVDQVLQAAFVVTLRSKQFDMITRSIAFSIDLDFNASGGGGTSPFIEDFEGGSFGKFTLQSLDAGKNSLTNSDGMRCQYNDPAGLNTNSATNPDCFLGFASDGTTGVSDWHVHTGTNSQGNVGRAYTGAASAHYGLHNSAGSAKRDTTRFKQLDAIVTVNPINLPLAAASPELTFAHQVAFVDNRGIGGITAGECADRGVVQVNVLTGTGQATTWVGIQAFENAYEEQGTDDFYNCTFDPTDDGNNEDSFFDPTDPLRRLGPSSTCYPEFVYARSGDTDYRHTYDPANIGLADPGSGRRGSINVGTWVRPRFSLQPYAARRLRLRFLATSIELGASQTWDAGFFNRDDVVTDDGWYIDDVRVEKALGIALSLSIDTKTITPLATCGTCSSIVAALAATPDASAGPGQLVSLDAKASAMDVCLNGVPQFQFWLDGNENEIVGDAGDMLLRDFTEDSTFLDAPSRSTRYGVKVRCSSAPSCDGVDGSNAATALVMVPCPSTGAAHFRFEQTIAVDKAGLGGVEPDVASTVSWPSSAVVDAVRGDLTGLRAASGNFTGTVLACLGDNVSGAALPADALDPGAGNAFYYLVRPSVSPYCNAPVSFGSGRPTEAAGRDAEIAADPNACP